eukprot:138307-Pyramimonas_sp.AAC.1
MGRAAPNLLPTVAAAVLTPGDARLPFAAGMEHDPTRQDASNVPIATRREPPRRSGRSEWTHKSLTT